MEVKFIETVFFKNVIAFFFNDWRPTWRQFFGSPLKKCYFSQKNVWKYCFQLFFVSVYSASCKILQWSKQMKLCWWVPILMFSFFFFLGLFCKEHPYIVKLENNTFYFTKAVYFRRSSFVFLGNKHLQWLSFYVS